MKMLCILLLAASLQIAARGYSQGISISLKNAPLEKLFKLVEQQTNFRFVYSQEAMRLSKPVTIEVRNESLENILRLSFVNQPLTYSFEEKFIIIKLVEKRKEMAVPSIDARGRVVNENEEGVIATITEKGTKNAVSTDADGYFLIKNLGNDAILVITGVNIEPYEIKIDGRTDLSTITLKTKIITGNEIKVVSTGYQVIPKERATGSFAQPDRELFDARVSTDVISKLDGITSGVVFNRGTLFAPPISIRGRSTILANANPLIIVDNFPYDGDLNNINPNDIENITILKDAAAASIWGSFSGNGVIIITTKRGKYNQPLRIDLNTNVTVSSEPDLTYDRDYLPSSDFIDIEQFLFDKNYYNSDLSNATNRPPVSPVVEILAKKRAGTISATDADAQLNALRNIDVRNDLSKYFYQRSVKQQYALNLSGGSTKAAYIFSVGYDRNRYNNVGNGYNRITLNSVNTFMPVKNLELTAGFNYVQGLTENNSTVNDLRTGGPQNKSLYPYAQFADVQGNPLSILKDYRGSFIDTAGGGRLLNWKYIPLTELALADNTTKLYDTRITAGVRYTIIKGLSFEAKYQYEKGSSDNRVNNNPESYYVRNLVNKYTNFATNPITNNIPFGGILTTTNNGYESNNERAQLSYFTNRGDHEVSAIAGFDIRETKGTNNTSTLYGYNDDNATYKTVLYGVNFPTYPTGSSTILYLDKIGATINRYRSWFANGSYTFKGLYTVSASGRIDQSNLFGVKTNQKSVPLWSVGGKWNLSKESFYHIEWLPSLNLRATYGFNGNLLQNGTAYTTAQYSSSPATDIQPQYASITSPGNPELKWERMRMINFGIDFSFSKSILSGSLEYFAKKGFDMIGQNSIPSSTGFLTIIGNFSNMEGSGFDVVLNTKNIDRTIKWTTTLLLSYATDKVTKYKGTITSTTILEGRPVQSIYSYRWAGLDPETGDPMGYLADTISKVYSALVNQTIDTRKYGAANPVFFGGFRNTISYKHFSLAVNVSFKAGYYFRKSTINYANLFSGWNANMDYTQRWQTKGDENNTSVPSMIFPANTQRETFYANSEVNVERGDHVRLQDIALSYDLDKTKFRKMVFNKMQIYLYANNIGILWRANKYGIDPDYQSGYPPPRTLSLGFKAGF